MMLLFYKKWKIKITNKISKPVANNEEDNARISLCYEPLAVTQVSGAAD